MSNSNVLTTEDLAAATNYPGPGLIEKCLQRNSIKYFNGKDGPWTTLGLVEAAGGIVRGVEPDEEELII